MKIKDDFLSQIERADPEATRLLLLTRNYFFNKLTSNIRQERKQVKKNLKVKKMAQELSFRASLLETYIEMKRFTLRDIEAQQSIYYVYDTAMGPKHVIDEDGIYIKIDPDISNLYYRKVIKQARAEWAFMDASIEAQNKYLSKKGNFTLNFLDGKKAPKHKKQHGYNQKEDIHIYLQCEQEIEDVFTTTGSEEYWDNYEREKDQTSKLKKSIERAALDLECDFNKVRRIYYEVCKRYNLPTFEAYLRLNRYFRRLRV